jgi:hypothetical protein
MDEAPDSFPTQDLRLIGIATDQEQHPVKPFWIGLDRDAFRTNDRAQA